MHYQPNIDNQSDYQCITNAYPFFSSLQLERIVDLKYSSPPDNTEVIRGAIQATVKAAKEVS